VPADIDIPPTDPAEPGPDPAAATDPEAGLEVEAEARPEPDPEPVGIVLYGFGQRLELTAPGDPARRAEAERRLRRIHEPALCAWTLAPGGVALDIGAGFGAFALPFARAFPGWTVWCFEPDPDLFALLQANIAATGVGNVRAVPCAVGGPLPGGDPAALAAALEAGDAAALPGLCPAGPLPGGGTGPVLPAEALLALAPRLLKLDAPGTETEVLEGLAQAPLDHLLGEFATLPPSRLVFRGPGLRQTWAPVAGSPLFRLRRSADPGERRPGLDVVVAMYNGRDWIEACVDGILEGASDEVRALVVDDGSTDGSAEVVRELYGHDRRVVLLRKLNGGCASARNYGRLMSDAAHIAFVDADDIPGPGLFSELLELARYTGAEVVQGGFELLHMEAGGRVRRVPSYEASEPAFHSQPRRAFGSGGCRVLPASLLIEGQPTIWRRVYRRDFLDNRDIWFPEHIRAFDDQIFQLLTLQHARNVPMLDHVHYGYRQHPAQDIRQGDERAFYSLEMFRLMLKRALREGWGDFAPLLRSYVNTVNWCWSGLRRDLQPRFAQAAAELWVLMEKALGAGATRPFGDTAFAAHGFAHHAERLRRDLAGLGDAYAWASLDSAEMHVAAIRMSQRVTTREGSGAA